MANGTSCVCTANTDDAGPDDAGDAGSHDAGDAADAPPAPDLSNFLGEWSPIGGTGQSNCAGQITSLPPNTGAILTFVQAGPNTLTATSAGAYGCTLTLLVSGETATLSQASELCAVPTGGSVAFSTFTLVYTPGLPDGGLAVDSGGSGVDSGGSGLDSGEPGSDGGDAGLVVGDASLVDDADAEGAPATGDAAVDGGSSEDGATPSEDGATSGEGDDAGGPASSSDAGVDAPAPSDDAGPAATLDWQLADTEGTCLTTLHYTLARTH